VNAPLVLKVEQIPWPIRTADAIICINMTHISPWSATEALFESGVRTLSAGAPLYLYGSYRRGGAHSFEPRRIRCEPSRSQRRVGRPRSGRCRGPRARERFGEPQIVDMPASNLSVIFRRT
jgi:hypothetical protein